MSAKTKNKNYKLKKWIKRFAKPNTFQFILIWYLIFVFVGAGLLMAPISVNWDDKSLIQSNHYDFMSALFTATSAFSDTGLVVTPTDDTFKPFGQVVIYFLILIGGLGLMVVIILIYKSFFPKRKLRFDTIVLLQSERGSETMNETTKLIFSGVIFILILNFICAILLMFSFYFIPATTLQSIDTKNNPGIFEGFSHKYERVYHNWLWSFWNGMFDSVSALDNAGFTLFGESSMSAYRNGLGIFPQAILMMEWFLGGLGFPVIYEIYQYIKAKKQRKDFKFSLFSKLCLIGISSVLIISTALAYIFAYFVPSGETNWLIIVKNIDPNGKLNTIYSPWGTNPVLDKNWAIFWNCFSTRSAGFDSYNLGANSEASRILYSILMYIGSSPSSTGGGIRITTFLIVMYALFVRFAGREKVSMFKKTISKSTINDSFLIFLFAIGIVLITTFVVHFTYNGQGNMNNLNSFVNDFFVVSSAFGTCGLSVGNLTNCLEWGGLLFLIITMFIGQLGVSTTILSVSKRHDKDAIYNWPVEDVRVG